MEEDDDFGELYTDVLHQFTSATSPSPTTPFQIRPQIDLNTIDDETPVLEDLDIKFEGISEKGIRNSDQNAILMENDAVFENGGCNSSFAGKGELEESRFDVVVEKDDDLVQEGGNLESSGMMVIPGLESRGGGDLNFEESESDSEDDLQIVLNNDNEMGGMGMGMERMGGMEEEDEDGDDRLVILAGNDSLGNQPTMENQEWGEDGGTGTDGERKELGESSKVDGGVAGHPKAPYGFHHPFHSQFKVSAVEHLGYHVYRLFFDEFFK